jgi:hypothetical protein
VDRNAMGIFPLRSERGTRVFWQVFVLSRLTSFPICLAAPWRGIAEQSTPSRETISQLFPE